MSPATKPVAPPHASNKRSQVPTPESEQPNKRPKTVPAKNPALHLALDHLHVDPPSHPLHKRNADFVIDSALGDGGLEAAVKAPINHVLALVDKNSTGLKASDKTILRRRVLTIATQRILESLGLCLDGTFHFAKMQSNMNFEHDGNGYKSSLNIRPVMSLEDDGSETGSLSTQAPRKTPKPRELARVQIQQAAASRQVGRASATTSGATAQNKDQSGDDSSSEDDSEDDDDDSDDSSDSSSDAGPIEWPTSPQRAEKS